MMPVRMLFLVALLLAACRAPDKESKSAVPQLGQDPVENLDPDEPPVIARRIERNIRYWRELQIQGMSQQSTALRLTVARSVDENFDALRELAFHGEFHTHRSPAVRCLGFASQRRDDARVALEQLCGDRTPWIAADAALGLGTLRHKDTDLTSVISLCGSGDVHVRTNAATALVELFLVKETPRKLPPQYLAAIDRLATMLYDKASVRSRRAAVWALANLRHPDVLDHLIGALQDEDEQVQTGGLRGIQVLGDQRALEAVLAYLDDGPTREGASWAKEALVAIVTQTGLVDDASQLDELGTSPKLWRSWIEQQRMR